MCNCSGVTLFVQSECPKDCQGLLYGAQIPGGSRFLKTCGWTRAYKTLISLFGESKTVGTEKEYLNKAKTAIIARPHNNIKRSRMMSWEI